MDKRNMHVSYLSTCHRNPSSRRTDQYSSNYEYREHCYEKQVYFSHLNCCPFFHASYYCNMVRNQKVLPCRLSKGFYQYCKAYRYTSSRQFDSGRGADHYSIPTRGGYPEPWVRENCVYHQLFGSSTNQSQGV